MQGTFIIFQRLYCTEMDSITAVIKLVTNNSLIYATADYIYIYFLVKRIIPNTAQGNMSQNVTSGIPLGNVGL